MARVCVETPAGRVCGDDGRRNNRHPYQNHGYGGYDRGQAARDARERYWRNQGQYGSGYGYQDPHSNYGRRPDPRDLDGDGRVERWEIQEHRRMQQQQRYGAYRPEYVPTPQNYYGGDPRRPYYDAPYFRDDQAAAQMADPRNVAARDGVITLRELTTMLLGEIFNGNEMNALLRDASDGQLNDQRLLNQLFGKQVRLADNQGQTGPDVSARAAQIVQEHARGR